MPSKFLLVPSPVAQYRYLARSPRLRLGIKCRTVRNRLAPLLDWRSYLACVLSPVDVRSGTVLQHAQTSYNRGLLDCVATTLRGPSKLFRKRIPILNGSCATSGEVTVCGSLRDTLKPIYLFFLTL